MNALIWVRRYYALDLPHETVGWPSWAMWRWAQMYPEDIGYADVEYVSHREVL